MWIESEHSNRNVMYKLYNNFSDCLLEEDKKKLKKLENYCGHQALMEIFIKCYYVDIGASWAGREVINRSWIHRAEQGNWNCIIESYNNFRLRFRRNSNLQQEVIDSSYGLIHDNVLSCCWDNPDIKRAYLSWEDYLSSDDYAFNAWKEIHSAFLPKDIVRFRKDMSRILDESDVHNPNSEAFKLSQQQGSAKYDEQMIYRSVVNKLLSDYWYALEERKSNRITWDRRYLRERLFKIISCYRRWSEHCERQEKILQVMMESNYGPESNTIEVDWEVVPNLQKLNRWSWEDLREKEYVITEKAEELESEESQKAPQKVQQKAGENQWAVGVPVIIQIDKDEEDEGGYEYGWQEWANK